MVFVAHIGTPLVKANDALLSFSLLFSLVVTFLCSIVFLGKPQPWSCMTSQVALALGFALCLSSIMGEFVAACMGECAVHIPSILWLLCDSGKTVVLMLRARALKAERIRAKAAAKAAKLAAAEAAQAAADGGSPDVIATFHHAEAKAAADSEVDSLTCGHQRAIAAVATLIQVETTNTASKACEKHLHSDLMLHLTFLYPGCGLHGVAHHHPATPRRKHLHPEHKDHPGVRRRLCGIHLLHLCL